MVLFVKKLVVKTSLSFVIFTLLASCSSIKPKGASGSANKVYHKFYTSEGATQYFITPIQFDAKNGNCFIDFTLRDDFADNDSVTVNITIIKTEAVKDFSNSYFSANNTNYTILSNKRLFIEKNKEKYNSRYTSKLLFKDFITISQNLQSLTFTCDSSTYYPSKKAKKSLVTINEEITEIIILNAKD